MHSWQCPHGSALSRSSKGVLHSMAAAQIRAVVVLPSPEPPDRRSCCGSVPAARELASTAATWRCPTSSESLRGRYRRARGRRCSLMSCTVQSTDEGAVSCAPGRQLLYVPRGSWRRPVRRCRDGPCLTVPALRSRYACDVGTVPRPRPWRGGGSMTAVAVPYRAGRPAQRGTPAPSRASSALPRKPFATPKYWDSAAPSA